MLLEIAIGDAYGACFEYAAPTPDRPNDISGYTQNPVHSIGGGRYTDDCQMSIAVAETLLDGDLTREAFAESFVRCYRRDPRVGYSRTMQDFIASCRDGADLLDRIRPDSEKSGAAMRVCPVGLLVSEEEVLAVAEAQARVTHDTAGGVASAQAAALMVHALRYNRVERRKLPQWISARVEGPWAEPWQGPVGSKGVDSVRAALWATVENKSLSRILRACIDYTGDVDTVAAVAMGAASMCLDVEQDIPPQLIEGLENGRYGSGFLIDLDKRLEQWAEIADAPPR